MYFIIILAVLIALGTEVSPEAVLEPGYNAALTLLFTIVVVALAPVPGIVLSATVRPERLSDSFTRAHVLKRVRVGSILYQAYLLASFAVVTYVLDWPVLIDGTLRMRRWVLIDELLKVLPFLVMLVLAWMPLYRIDRKLRQGTWSLREYIEFHLRQYVLFVLVPFVALVTVVDVLGLLPWSRTLERMGLDWVVPVAGMAAVFIFFPHLVRFVWKTRHMEESPLRTRLVDLCGRAKIACRDILVWETMGGQVVNACVSGILASVRYVMVTDALMESLSQEEIEGVFAHEIGHVRRHHMVYYGVFILGFVAVLVLMGSTGMFTGKSSGWHAVLSLENLLVVAFVVIYWGVAFGWVSRRMELEADLYAVELTGNAGSFANALERISCFSGRDRTSGSWRHFSIAKRTGFVLALDADPARRERFRASMSVLRWGIVAWTLSAASAAVVVILL